MILYINLGNTYVCILSKYLISFFWNKKSKELDGHQSAHHNVLGKQGRKPTWLSFYKGTAVMGANPLKEIEWQEPLLGEAAL